MSHLSCIGLDVASQQELAGLVERMLEDATEEVPAQAKTRHLRWRDPSGASVAFHLEDEALACVTPFFAPATGLSRWPARTTAAADDPSCVHCGGADCDLLDAGGELATRSAVQWLYFATYRDWLRRPRTFELEVAGFAHSAAFFADAAGFEAGQARYWGDRKGPTGQPLRFAEVSFLPEGMFAPAGTGLDQRAVAMITGRVEQATRLQNALTGTPFWHVRLTTLPGPLDVVASIAAVEGEPTAGGLAMVRAWLVGRPVEPPPSPAERSWLRRVFGR